MLAELNENQWLTRELRQVEPPVRAEPIILGTRRANMTQDLWQDLRYSIRTMLKQPGFTVIAVLTLGLGVGPITAIFTLVHAVLLKPLPFKAPERLVRIYKNANLSASVPDFVEWRDQNQV